MLLLEVLRRAAHDWVLYRTSTRLPQKQIADEAYAWIFKEEPGTAQWAERIINKKELTSFIGICEVLSLDPDVVRRYIKNLTVKEILSTGRPPTYRRQKERKRRIPLLQPPVPQVLQLPAAKIIHVPAVVIVRTPILIQPANEAMTMIMRRAQKAADSIKALIRG